MSTDGRRPSHAGSSKAPECTDACLYEFGAEWCAAFDAPCIKAHERVPVCPCGRNLHIWQNPWNHAAGCSMQPVAKDET